MITQITRDGGHFQQKWPGFVATGDLPLAAPRVRGAYLHVPFCVHKCHYCDFYSLVEADSRDRRGPFADRMAVELRTAGAMIRGPLETVYVGGGTPTLLEPSQWGVLLQALGDHLPLADDLEFTVEANPETVTDELAGTLVAGGVNRMSIGAQSFDRRHLRSLERRHDPARVCAAVKLARSAGIGSVNLDLIFAIPGQSLDDWLADLELALALRPDHLSCYALTYEPNTPLTVKRRAGVVQAAPEDLEAAMYRAVIDRLGASGFEHYEVSAWARPGHRCRHNLIYWTNEPWWPFGPSACGHVDGWRWRNVPRLGDYLAGAGWPPIDQVERLDADGSAGEAIMLGLRLLDGIALDRLEQLLSSGRSGPQRRAAIDRHTAEGLLETRAGRLRLTTNGLMLADTVIVDLL